MDADRPMKLGGRVIFQTVIHKGVIKVPRRILQVVLSCVIVIIVLLFCVNVFIRVSDGESDNGIIEEKLFGRSAVSFFLRSFRSDSLNKWSDSEKISARVAASFAEYGYTLVTDPNFKTKREISAREAHKAYEFSSTVPEPYLATSNPNLPKMYREHFVQAMRLWAEGLEKADIALVRDGTGHYNAFLQWIQSQNRNDFKRLK